MTDGTGRYRLHIPGEHDVTYQPDSSLGEALGEALIDAVWLARGMGSPVHVIDTRPGGGLVTVIGPPGSWDKP